MALFRSILGRPRRQRDPLSLRLPAPRAEAGDGAAHGHERHPTLLSTGEEKFKIILNRTSRIIRHYTVL